MNDKERVAHLEKQLRVCEHERDNARNDRLRLNTKCKNLIAIIEKMVEDMSAMEVLNVIMDIYSE